MVCLAWKYIDSYIRISRGSIHESEIRTFGRYYSARVVFESNLIEGAGLPYGETQRFILEYFPVFPSTFEQFLLKAEDDPLKLFGYPHTFIKAHQSLLKEGINPARLIPSVSMAGASRPVREVVQHYFAISEAMLLCFEY